MCASSLCISIYVSESLHVLVVESDPCKNRVK